MGKLVMFTNHEIFLPRSFCHVYSQGGVNVLFREPEIVYLFL